MAEWEARISMYRNGRRVETNDAMGENPRDALYTAMNDLMRWAEDHPESRVEISRDRPAVDGELTDTRTVEEILNERFGDPLVSRLDRRDGVGDLTPRDGKPTDLIPPTSSSQT